jgi:hypothetical protein
MVTHHRRMNRPGRCLIALLAAWSPAFDATTPEPPLPRPVTVDSGGPWYLPARGQS